MYKARHWALSMEFYPLAQLCLFPTQLWKYVNSQWKVGFYSWEMVIGMMLEKTGVMRGSNFLVRFISGWTAVSMCWLTVCCCYKQNHYFPSLLIFYCCELIIMMESVGVCFVFFFFLVGDVEKDCIYRATLWLIWTCLFIYKPLTAISTLHFIEAINRKSIAQCVTFICCLIKACSLSLEVLGW